MKRMKDEGREKCKVIAESEREFGGIGEREEGWGPMLRWKLSW